MKDIIIAVADVYMEKVLEALLHRVPQSSGTATYTYDIIRNPGHDSGSYNDSHELLRPFITQYKFALVLFDLEGCGAEHNKTREEISKDVGDLLNKNGWENRNEVIVRCFGVFLSSFIEKLAKALFVAKMEDLFLRLRVVLLQG